MNRKQTGWVLIWALAVLVSGCTKKEAEPKTEAPPETKFLVLATTAAVPPFSMRDANSGEVVGLDMDLARAIAEQVGQPLKIEVMPADRLMSALAEGKADLALARLEITDENQKSADFSAPYYVATPVVMSVAGDVVPESQEDLKGMRIGVRPGSTGEALALELTPADQVVRFEADGDAATALLGGQVNCVILEQQVADHLAKNHFLLMPLRFSEFVPVLYGAAVRKGDAELLAKVNETLAMMEADGRREQLVDQWIAPAAGLQGK